MIEIKLTPAQNNWLEATWTEVTQAPDVITPAVPDQIIPATPDELDDDGYLVSEGQPEQIIPGTPETITPGAITRTELKHTSYHPTQQAMLRADAEAMGTSLDDYEEMLVLWVASYVPPPPPARTKNDVMVELAQIDQKSIRALREGNQTRLASLEAQAVALRAELAAL